MLTEMSDPFNNLVTESRAGHDDLDLRSARDLVALMNEADATVAGAVAGELDAIAGAVEGIAGRLRAGGRLVYVGAGTSGRLAAVDAAECAPTFNIDPGVIRAVVAGGPDAVHTSIEEAEDDPNAGRGDLAALAVSGSDAVVGVSASGRTPYVIGALALAREVGALTVALSCNAGAEVSGLADHPIEVRVGPELIAGSTRLKAGTAQKMVLNMFSTAAMIRLGRTYGDLMVDVRSENEKLRARALRVVRAATGAGDSEAAEALAAGDHDAAVAVVMLRAGVDATTARSTLEAARGNVREAIDKARR